MKIVHVAYSCVPGIFRGGVAKVVFELAKAQASLNHQVLVHTTNINSDISVDVPLEKSVRIDGIEIVYHKALRFPEFSSRTLTRAVFWEAQMCDILHTHNTFLNFNRYVRAAATREHRPYFVHPHGALDPVVVRRGWLKSLKKRIYIYLVERRNLDRAAGVFALTDLEKAQLVDMGIRAPIHVMWNGVNPRSQPDPSVFQRRWGIENEAPIVMYIGRLHEKKGLDLLLRSFSRIAARFPTAKLVLGGDRSQNIALVNRLDRIVKEAQIKDRVIWTGFMDEDAKAEALSAATLFSHVTQSEGMAMAILESMAAGLPTIVSAGCYMDRAVSEGALALSKYDAGQLAQTLEELLENPGLREELSRKAKAYVALNHNWKSIAQESIRIYQDSLSRESGRTFQR